MQELQRWFSLDEQYLACFLECVLCGSVDPAQLKRPKVKRILTEKAMLAQRIAECMTDDGKQLWWQPESQRVRNVVLKLARGHVALELSPQHDNPSFLDIIAFPPNRVERISWRRCVLAVMVGATEAV